MRPEGERNREEYKDRSRVHIAGQRRAGAKNLARDLHRSSSEQVAVPEVHGPIVALAPTDPARVAVDAVLLLRG